MLTMKKNKLKLAIKKATLRELSAEDSRRVVGGGNSMEKHSALSTGKQGASGIC